MDYGDPRLPPRFWEKVYPCPVTGCWLWGAAQHSVLPYGLWRRDGKNERAHVSIFLADGGELTVQSPNVLHSCDQPPCVRREHLRAGSQADNVQDLIDRDRGNLGRRTRLNVADIVQIRERYAANEPASELASEFGITQSSVNGIAAGRRWREAGGPLTGRRRLGSPNPVRDRPTCAAGHDLAGDNLRLKPNPRCRDGYERRCRDCERRRSIENNDRRRGVARKRANTHVG